MAKRRSLGRGLEALLSTASAHSAAVADDPAEETALTERGADEAPDRVEDTLRELPIDLLQRGRYQPRGDMREETLTELAESIRAQGIVQPIVVRPVGSASGGERRYEIIAGERRWRAAQLAGLHVVPALSEDIPDEAAAPAGPPRPLRTRWARPAARPGAARPGRPRRPDRARAARPAGRVVCARHRAGAPAARIRGEAGCREGGQSRRAASRSRARGD